MRSKNLNPVELGTENIGQLLKRFAIPAIIAMTATSLYNIVDSIFIGHGVGALGLSGLTVCFPLMNLNTAVGSLIGMGGSTMLSVLLGKSDYKSSRSVLGNQLTLKVLVGISFAVLCLLFLDPILYFFGASENTIGYARDYMSITLIGSTVTHLYFGFNHSIRASGNPRLAMWLTIFTVILNAAINPIFIFGLDMGVSGAALATVISQLAALILVFRYMYTSAPEFMRLRLKDIKIEWRLAKKMFAIGLSSFLINAAACIVSMLVNQQLLKYSGDLGIASYGIVNRTIFLVVMVNLGLSNGMQPIAGYNYGARKYNRVLSAFWRTALCATIVSAIGTIFCELSPKLAVNMYTTDEGLVQIAEKSLKIVGSSLFLVGFQIIASNLFVSIGMVNKSIFLSISRQVIILIPLLYCLPLLWGENGIWFSFPISDLIAFIITIITVVPTVIKLKHLKEGDSPAILGSKL